MLTGMIKPTSGNAYILGNSVTDDNNITKKFIGFCPQHSILYDCLTAKEHMQFYGCLKVGSNSVSYTKGIYFYLITTLQPLTDLYLKSKLMLILYSLSTSTEGEGSARD